MSDERSTADPEPSENEADADRASDACVAETEAATPSPLISADQVPERSPRGLRIRVGAILLAVAFLASAGLAGWLYLNQYRPDQQTDAEAAEVAREAASSGTIALLSYAPDSLDQDFAAAKARLTGDFLSYYTQFTEQIVTPAAREKSVRTEASVVRSAVSEIQPDSAEVLVFVNQTTTSKENPDGAFAASSVKVGLEKIDGVWLIASFDPV